MPAYTGEPKALREALTAVQFHEGGTFRPTLVIGLGGSGVNTVRRLKRLLHERYQVRGMIGFLFVDADQGAYEHDPLLAPVDPEEKAAIFVHNPDQLLEEYRKNPKLHPYFSYILNDNLDVTMLRHADGAAGIRPAGRFAFHASFDVLYAQSFEPAVRSIMQVEKWSKAMMQGVPQQVQIIHSEPRVYLISSLCGGTGSAIFMDTAMVMRYILKQNNLDGELVGVFYLPSVFRGESGISASLMEVIEANAYASLMELEHLCDASRGQRWEFRYPVIGDIILNEDEPLLDEVFLIEGSNAEGKGFSNKYDAFEMTARSILLDIGSPLGARARSARRNALAIIDTIPCAETNKPRLMNSLAVTSLAVPIRELLLYCAVRAAKETYEQMHAGGEFNVSNEVENFLIRNELDERGASHQILNALSKNADGNQIRYNLPTTTEVVDEAEGAGRRSASAKAQYFADSLQRRLQQVQQEWLPEQEGTICQNAIRLLQEAKKVIGKRASDVLDEFGHDAAMGFLGELIRIFEEVRDRRAEEQRQMENSVSDIERAINGGIENLKQLATQRFTLGGIFTQWGLMDTVTKTVEAGLGNISSVARQYLEIIARKYLHKLLSAEEGIGEEKALIPTLNEWLQLVQNWKTHRAGTIKLLSEKLSQQQGSTAVRSSNGYSLEWLALLRRDYDNFYSKLNINKEICQKWKKLRRESYHHMPAFGDLMKTDITQEEEANLLIEAAAEVLADDVRRKATILEVIQDKEGKSDDKGYIARKLEMLFNACEPFWSTSDPPGEPRYEVYVAVSVPPTSGQTGDGAQQIEQFVRELCERQGAKAEPVHDGYPFALTLMKRTYGARAYYLRSSGQMKTFYEKRSNDGVVKHRLHVDKRFFDLPKLHPVAITPERNELWAWGVAFGYIAQKGKQFVLGIQRGRGDVQMPKYASEWPLVLTDHLPKEWKRKVLAHVDRADVIGDDRMKAHQAFAADREKQHLLREARDYVERSILREPETYIQLLEEYIQRLLEHLNAEKDKTLRDLLQQEREALIHITNRLGEQSA